MRSYGLGYATPEDIDRDEDGAEADSFGCDRAPTDEERYREAVIKEAAGMLRETFAHLHQAAKGNQLRLAILVGIIGGCSLREVGSLYGITKQGAQKHLDAAIKAAPFLAIYRAHGNRNARARMGRTRGFVESVVGADQDLVEEGARFEDSIRRETKCLRRVNQNGTVIYSPAPAEPTIQVILDQDLSTQNEEFERLLQEAMK